MGWEEQPGVVTEHLFHADGVLARGWRWPACVELSGAEELTERSGQLGAACRLCAARARLRTGRSPLGLGTPNADEIAVGHPQQVVEAFDG